METNSSLQHATGLLLILSVHFGLLILICRTLTHVRNETRRTNQLLVLLLLGQTRSKDQPILTTKEPEKE